MWKYCPQLPAFLSAASRFGLCPVLIHAARKMNRKQGQFARSGKQSMLSWQAMMPERVFRFTMSVKGKAINSERIESLDQNPPRSALWRCRAGYRIESVRMRKGLEFDVADSYLRPLGAGVDHRAVLHGGGYLSESPKTHRQVSIAWPKLPGSRSTDSTIDWLPSIPFRRAVEDAAKAYEWLLTRHPRAAHPCWGRFGRGRARHRDSGRRSVTAGGRCRRPCCLLAVSALAVTGDSVEA